MNLNPMFKNVENFRTRLGITAALGLLLLVAVAHLLGHKRGLKVGDKAPNFKLMASNAKEYALTDLLQRGKVALVFYQSEDR